MTARTKSPPEPTDTLVVDIETVVDGTLWPRQETPPGATPVFPPPWAHQVVAIGCLWLGPSQEPKHVGLIGHGEVVTPERVLLQQLFKFIGDHPVRLVTYNGNRFDLPVMSMRAFHHALVTKPTVRGLRGIDVHAIFARHNNDQNISLNSAAKLMGLPGKSGHSGKDVAELFATTNMAALQRYCLEDVAQTAVMMLRWMLIHGRIDARTYRGRVGVLLEFLGRDPRLTTFITSIDLDRVMAPDPVAVEK
jgi:predicted PolB exonuclease-like 3'-5' exonuclease